MHSSDPAYTKDTQIFTIEIEQVATELLASGNDSVHGQSRTCLLVTEMKTLCEHQGSGSMTDGDDTAPTE